MIKINVGGKVFSTTLGTLEKATYFQSLLSGSYNTGDKVRDDNGNIFIDRDPELFEYVLSYLRNMHLETLFLRSQSRKDLYDELIFYGVPDICPAGLIKIPQVNDNELINIHQIANSWNMVPPPDRKFSFIKLLHHAYRNHSHIYSSGQDAYYTYLQFNHFIKNCILHYPNQEAVEYERFTFKKIFDIIESIVVVAPNTREVWLRIGHIQVMGKYLEGIGYIFPIGPIPIFHVYDIIEVIVKGGDARINYTGCIMDGKLKDKLSGILYHGIEDISFQYKSGTVFEKD